MNNLREKNYRCKLYEVLMQSTVVDAFLFIIYMKYIYITGHMQKKKRP